MFACHVKLAFAFVSERSEAGDKLQIMKPVVSEKLIYPFGVLSAASGQNRQNVKFRFVFAELVCRFENFIIRVLTALSEPETVCLKVAVKAQADKKAVFREKLRPRVVNKGSVGLNAVIYFGAFEIVFVNGFDEKLKKVHSGKKRFSALKSKSNAASVGKRKGRDNEIFCRVLLHHSEIEVFTVSGNIAIKAIFAAKIAKSGSRFNHY